MEAEALYRQLLDAYGTPRWWSEDPYTVLFQAVLVQNTTWRHVETTCAAMGKPLRPEVIAGLPVEALEAMIRPCGFHRAKARTIRTLTDWFGRYGYDRDRVLQRPMEALRRELLALRGIGAETADVILVYAFYKPSFVIDAYTRRLLARLGCRLSDDSAIRRFFEDALPRDARLYGAYHWLILEHCIDVCRKKPLCDRCALQASCRRVGVA